MIGAGRLHAMQAVPDAVLASRGSYLDQPI
jgi:hypothetical protein